MIRRMLKSKMHRVTVTDADVEYEGSITIDESLMDSANILPFEQVHIYNISNGNRFVTYCIEGKRGSGEICINGAAARLAKKGDQVIIATYVDIEDKMARNFQPILICFDEKNRVKKISPPVETRRAAGA